MQKGVKSSKAAQALFLDLVPAMPSTPITKGSGPSDTNRGFASQEAVTALAETLAKRDAEVCRRTFSKLNPLTVQQQQQQQLVIFCV